MMVLLSLMAGSASGMEKVTELSQLDGKTFAVPSGTVADQLVFTMFPGAVFRYYDTALDARLAVKAGEADAVAYDEPILKNIAAKNPGLVVLPEMITKDDYGFAVRLDQQDLRDTKDTVITTLKNSGTYDVAGCPGKAAPRPCRRLL